ncbi:MAG: hypothetical protein NTV81_00775 [Candidatus Komeilibacteria bacterium]|nr:hypothetical protein [Candidatus Komeilibacteria bacterium]
MAKNHSVWYNAHIMKKKIVIGFAGKISSGKGSAAAHLAKKPGVALIVFSNCLRGMLTSLHLPINRLNLRKISLALRQAFGQDAFSKAVAAEISQAKQNLVVIDGVRRWPDVVGFNRQFNFFLVYIESEAKLRWQRAVSRNQNQGDGSTSWSKFLKQDQSETEATIEALKKKANFIITNNGTRREFLAALDQVLKKILIK